VFNGLRLARRHAGILVGWRRRLLGSQQLVDPVSVGEQELVSRSS
jgi:hypothetical protein